MLAKQKVERIKEELEMQRKTVRREEARKFTKVRVFILMPFMVNII